MIFEITITYYAVDPDSKYGAMKKYIRTIGCEGENYTDAEAIATQWANEEIEEEYSIRPIKELNVTGVYDNEKLPLWFICQGAWEEFNDMTQKSKTYKTSILVKALNASKAGESASKILNECYNDARIINVKETKIEKYIVST